ncbi:hypothetical protein V1514DRAFT_319167 [Lipomyces japonicus]|uniref:uncharacterized protein n=1 Tax=Lipomyces japonicus TaxID=56871 RepID=UPI0034CEE9C8
MSLIPTAAAAITTQTTFSSSSPALLQSSSNVKRDEIDSILERISAKHDVRGVIVIDLDQHGVVVRSRSSSSSSSSSSTWNEINDDNKLGEDNELAAKYAQTCVDLVRHANQVAVDIFDDQV